MQLSTIRELVRDRVGLSADDSMAQDAVLNRLINAALRQVQTIAEWPWLEATATVAAESDGKIPTSGMTGFRKVAAVSEGENDLPYRSPRYRARYKNVKGKPTCWTREAANFYTMPAPTADGYDVTVRYHRTEPELTTDAQEPLMPDWAIDLLIAQVCILVARRFRNGEQTNHYIIEREEALRALRDEITLVGQGTTPMRVRP